MSREAVALLKGAGYTIKQKMGKQKFISVFRSMNSSARIRRKREKLITKLIAECFADTKITKRLRRHEDLTNLALKVHHILRHPEYRDMTHKDTLRSTIAHLLVDKDHRETVEKVLKENKRNRWPEYHPLCKARKIRNPQTAIKTIFTNLDKAWNYDRGRYCKNKAGIKFQKAVRDLLSRDWITNYCLLAGYVPVMKERKLGYVGKTIGETCGCRTLDRFALRKSSLKKIYREANNYRYHTMKRSLKRIEQKRVLKLHRQKPSNNVEYSCSKYPRPGVWTRVFRATSAEISKSGATPFASNTGPTTVSSGSELSEKAFAARDVKEISSPFLNNKGLRDVAIKAFAVTPDLPLKLLPARVLTFMELATVLDHPNIIPFVESFATSSEIFVVMPYAQNRSLHHIINNHGRLMQKTAQVWTFQIAMAIQYLHAAGIIHRNIKCSNILITQDYDAVLSGFGSAKIKWLNLLHLQETESSNFHAGYRPYRAPEILRKRPYSLPPIDVWSLGVVLFRMLNNCFPYCYHNKELMCKQQYFSKWKKTWRRDSPVSEHCFNLLKKMLQPNPSKRIKIDGVVNHCWFAELPIPNSHKKAVRKAAFLFVPKEPTTSGEEFQTVTKQVSHKDVATTLEELHSFLDKITKPSENRAFQPVDSLPAYKECYTKFKLRRGALVRNIDKALKRQIPKVKRPPPPLEYEPYVSDQEKTEIQEQTEAGIHELKKRPEQARKFLRTPEADNRMKLSLIEVVKNVKTKSEKFRIREDDLAKKFALFAPRREASEPRSILASTKSVRAGGANQRIQSGATGSIGSLVSWTPSRGQIPFTSDMVAPITARSIQLAAGSQPLPKLEFVKAERSISETELHAELEDFPDEEKESVSEYDAQQEEQVYGGNPEDDEDEPDSYDIDNEQDVEE